MKKIKLTHSKGAIKQAKYTPEERQSIKEQTREAVIEGLRSRGYDTKYLKLGETGTNALSKDREDQLYEELIRNPLADPQKLALLESQRIQRKSSKKLEEEQDKLFAKIEAKTGIIDTDLKKQSMKS